MANKVWVYIFVLFIVLTQMELAVPITSYYKSCANIVKQLNFISFYNICLVLNDTKLNNLVK